jgi:cytochrome c-type biogenesis protein
MLPILIGYVGGYANLSRGRLLLQVLLFILGTSTILTVLGVGASLLGIAFGSWLGSGWYAVMGTLAVLMGLQLLGVLHIPFPQVIQKMPETRSGQLLAPYLLGLAFGAASSPCGTPFLTAILGFISRENDLWLGGVSLFFYGLGQGIIFLVVGLFTGLLKHLAMLRRVGAVINAMSGIVFIIAGLVLLLMATGWLEPLWLSVFGELPVL